MGLFTHSLPEKSVVYHVLTMLYFNQMLCYSNSRALKCYMVRKVAGMNEIKFTVTLYTQWFKDYTHYAA